MHAVSRCRSTQSTAAHSSYTLCALHPQYSYLVLLFHCAAQALCIDFYLEGGEDSKLFGCTPCPRAFFLFSSASLFILLQRSDRAGWVETTQPRETRGHWHTLSCQMCAQEWWRCLAAVAAAVLYYISALSGTITHACREMWSRPHLDGPFMKLSVGKTVLSIS